MADLTVFGCTCGFRSIVAGPCRSHPYPCRAMGPEMDAIAISTEPADPRGREELAAFLSARTKLSPAEAMRVVRARDAGARRMVENVIASVGESPRPQSWGAPRHL